MIKIALNWSFVLLVLVLSSLISVGIFLLFDPAPVPLIGISTLVAMIVSYVLGLRAGLARVTIEGPE